MNNKLKTISNLFEDKQIRSIWNSEEEEYYFSVVDVISALTDSNNPRNYWNMIKKRMTDALDTKGIFRLIESVPSPKAEPFKMWLATLGKERIDETFDPSKAIDRSIMIYKAQGYSDAWIEKRLKGQLHRFQLTDVWKSGGIDEPVEYGVLTNEIYKAWSDMKANEYKVFI